MTPDPSCPPGPINVMVQPDNFWNNSKPKTEQDSVKPSQGQTPPPHSPPHLWPLVGKKAFAF